VTIIRYIYRKKLFLTKVVFSKVQSRNLGRKRYDLRSDRSQLQMSSGSVLFTYILINKLIKILINSYVYVLFKPYRSHVELSSTTTSLYSTTSNVEINSTTIPLYHIQCRVKLDNNYVVQYHVQCRVKLDNNFSVPGQHRVKLDNNSIVPCPMSS
jgi:hypothetical protein